MKSTLFSLSLAAMLGSTVLTGCGGKPAATTKEPAPADAHGHDDHANGHDHNATGPHGGILVELGGEEYHAEIAHDDTTKTVTVYLLDSTAKKAVSSEAAEVVIHAVCEGKPRSFSLSAKPLADEKEGASSRFELVSEELVEAHDAPTGKARLSVTIGGKPFSAAIEPHSAAEHKH